MKKSYMKPAMSAVEMVNEEKILTVSSLGVGGSTDKQYAPIFWDDDEEDE